MNYLLKTINKLNDSNIKNPLLESDYWIYDVDRVFHKGDFYLKVYVLNKLQNNNQPDQLTFLIEDQDISYELKAHEFSLIEEFKNINFFGVLLKLSHEPTENLDLKIISYIRDNQKYGIFNHYQTIKLEKQLETIQGSHLNFLIKHNKKYNYYPMILNNDLWLCRCGSINHESICPICGFEKDNIVIEYGNSIEEYIYKKVREKDIQYNLKNSFKQNIDSYFSVLSNYNIDYNKFLSKEELEDLENRYTQLQEETLGKVNKDNLVFNLDKSFEQNRKDFLNKLELNQEYQEKVFSEEELKEFETTYNSQVKKKTKRRLILIFLIFSTLISTFFAYKVFNDRFIQDRITKNLISEFNKKNSVSEFELLMNKLNKKSKKDINIKLLNDIPREVEIIINSILNEDDYNDITFTYQYNSNYADEIYKNIRFLRDIIDIIDFEDFGNKENILDIIHSVKKIIYYSFIHYDYKAPVKWGRIHEDLIYLRKKLNTWIDNN